MNEFYATLIGIAIGSAGLFGGLLLGRFIDWMTAEDALPDSWTPGSDDMEDQYK